MTHKIILLTGFLLLTFRIFAQEVTINIIDRNIPIEEAFRRIEKQTSYSIAFNRTKFDASKRISVTLKDASINNALNEILRDTGFGYKINGHHIVIVENKDKTATFTVSGYVKDDNSTETLIGAGVYDKTSLAGTSANQYGFYSLTLPEGGIDLAYSYVGYTTTIINFRLTRDTIINVSLTGSVHLAPVEITASKSEPIQERSQMSFINLPMAQIKSMPAFLGEADVLKTLQLMPGVQSGGEGRSGLYVRGGGPDQNLFLLDGVPVYNVSHLFGFFSVFNADAVNSVEMLKGGFPARYGGRVSSVVDINLKEGNMHEFHGDISMGLISSKLTLEGPIWKDKTSFIISGRRSYIDVLTMPVMALMDADTRPSYYFYDLTAKVNHRFSDKDRIYLSMYAGDDAYRIKQYREETYYDHADASRSNSGMKWGNMITAFRWNHVFSQKLFANATVTYGKYHFLSDKEIRNTRKDWSIDAPEKKTAGTSYYASKNTSNIRDWGAKAAFDYRPSPAHYIRFGAGATLHAYTPEATATKRDSVAQSSGTSKLPGTEYDVYIEDDITLTRRLKANIGVHWSAFDIENTFRQAVQPRVSMRYMLTDQLSAKASYSRMVQYIHLLTNSNIGLQQDLWVPSNKLLRPQKSDQVALGLAQNFREEYEISLEGYYKLMDNVTEYKDGTTFFDAGNAWDEKILQGNGRSYGVEIFAQKKTGTFTGWIGYTLSWTDRQFDEINGGKRFYYKYDRRHDLSIALMKRFGKKVELSGTWVFGSGTWTTIPVGTYNLIWGRGAAADISLDWGQEYIDYGERNGYRMDVYHRLDIGVSLIKKKKRGERRWVFGLYNAYCRRNPFYIDARERKLRDKTQEIIARKYEYTQFSLFPIIPSVSYQFKF